MSLINRVVLWFSMMTEILLGRLFSILNRPANIRKLPADALRDKVIIVTGCTSGIGAESARRFLTAGAKVIMACRATMKAETLLASWRDKTGFTGEAEIVPLDLGDFTSVKTFAHSMSKKYPRIDVLVNNAGLFDMMGRERKETVDGYEEHLQVNFLAPVLLSYMLLPSLLRSEAGRIVNVSSAIHKTGVLSLGNMNLQFHWTSHRAYASSKLLQVMLTRASAERLKDSGVKMVALHPGNVISDVARTLPRWIQYLYRTVGLGFLLTPLEGSDGSIHASIADDLKDGAYYSYCVPAKPHPAAEDPVLCRKVWHAACDELGLDEDWLRSAREQL